MNTNRPHTEGSAQLLSFAEKAKTSIAPKPNHLRLVTGS